jgi:hypothetical protein
LNLFLSYLILGAAPAELVDSGAAPIAPLAGSIVPPASGQRRFWENNEEFTLEFVSNKSKKCAGCSCPIAYLAALPGDRLVVRHPERFVFPTGLPGDRWSSTGVSTFRKRNVFYHAQTSCVLDRFDPQYFAAMPLRLGSGVRGELLQFPINLQHPSLVIL